MPSTVKDNSTHMGNRENVDLLSILAAILKPPAIQNKKIKFSPTDYCYSNGALKISLIISKGKGFYEIFE